MLGSPETRQFEEAYRKYESGDRHKALQELHSLTEAIVDPIDKMGLLYHEVLWLLEMCEISRARDRLEVLKGLITVLSDAPSDGNQFAPDATLTVMARFAEAKLLLAEGKRDDGVAVLDDIVLRFPKQLKSTLPGIEYDYIQLTRGYFSGDQGHWEETISILESVSSPPETEKSLVSYYLGHCYYMLKNYTRAEMMLAEALKLGLSAKWECRAHYILGLTEYHLGIFRLAKHEFEKCLESADREYLSSIKISEWLEAASRRSELDDDAGHYRVQ